MTTVQRKPTRIEAATAICKRHRVMRVMSGSSSVYYGTDGTVFDSPADGRLALSTRLCYTLGDVIELVNELPDQLFRAG